MEHFDPTMQNRPAGAPADVECGADRGADRTAGEVVTLPRGWRAPRGATPLAQVDAYWHALRASRLVPTRAEVDPRGIEGALGQAFIVERIAPGHARIRIAGTHVSDLMGMEVRGMPLSALFEPLARSQLQAAMRVLFEGPAILRFALASEGRIGKPALNAEMVLYPLRNHMGEISRALGCIVTEGAIGRAPRRFSVLQSHRQTLYVPQGDVAEGDVAGDDAGTGVTGPADARDPASGPSYTADPAAHPAAAEPAAAFEATAVPWLRVVKGS